MGGAYPTRLELCGRSLAVRRSFELIARIEDRFGALAALQARARAGQLTAADYAELLALAVFDCADRPSETEIRAWILEAGIPAAMVPAVKILSALFIGAGAADQLERDDDGREEDGDSIVDPPTAASDGTGSSARPMPSDGGQANSGKPPSTS